MRVKTWVVAGANVVLAATLAAGTINPRLLEAQTAPQPKDCCKTTTEDTKFCCDDCCWSAAICTTDKNCKPAEE